MSNKVSPIPAGYNTITPYLVVNNAVKAIEFYKQAFGATVVTQAENQGKICHAELKIGDSMIMLADEFPEMGYRSVKAEEDSPFCILLYTDNVDVTVEKALALGAKSLKPVEDQFYGDRSGMILDPYGMKWNVATHIEDVSDEETKARMEKMNG